MPRARCVDDVQCPPIAPRATSEIDFPTTLQGKPDQAALVYWWHAVRGSDGALRADSIRVLRVGL